MIPHPHFVPYPRRRVLQETVLQLALLPRERDQGSVPDQPAWTPRWNCPAAAK